LSPNATAWEKKIHRHYGRIANVCKRINYDIKQGARNDQVLLYLQKIRNDSFFSALRENTDSLNRLKELESEFLPREKRVPLVLNLPWGSTDF
jgi:hypothetical protein